MSENLYIEGHIRDVQTRYLADQPDISGMLNSAKRNLENAFSYFGIVERFEESIQLFRSNFVNTLPYAVSTGSENRSNKATSELSPNAMARLRSLNSNDFELYEFGCRLFDKRIRGVSRK
jgi:hypothetical protein